MPIILYIFIIITIITYYLLLYFPAYFTIIVMLSVFAISQSLLTFTQHNTTAIQTAN